jgi:hypothetical protein
VETLLEKNRVSILQKQARLRDLVGKVQSMSVGAPQETGATKFGAQKDFIYMYI